MYESVGGHGGGAVKITSRHVELDGMISVNGEDSIDSHHLGSGEFTQ